MVRPLIWILEGEKAGDNAQLSELASRCTARIKILRLHYNVLHYLPNYLLGTGLWSLTSGSVSELVPPWPDLVLGAGKRSVPVVRWIKKMSGGHTRLVQLGRPRAPLDDFDLVVSTPQYGLPSHLRLFEMDLPFAVAKMVAQGEREKWTDAWKHLPRPLIAVVVGAGKFPMSLPSSALNRLGQAASAAAAGGSLLIIMSPRSEADAHLAIAREITVPHCCYPWSPNGDNPYQAALALADRFVVTSDSASMIGEALSTGKPVSLFLLPVSPLQIRWSARHGLGAWLARKGILQPPRDTSRISRKLLAGGYANELGTPDVVTRPYRRNDGEVVRRIEALLG
jgi:mitochondrial fission protein ELM1